MTMHSPPVALWSTNWDGVYSHKFLILWIRVDYMGQHTLLQWPYSSMYGLCIFSYSHDLMSHSLLFVVSANPFQYGPGCC